MDTFQKCLDKVLEYEGGWTNDKDDPGGATNRGIIQVEYDKYRRENGLSKQSVLYITLAEVRAIYTQNYWAPARCQYLATPLDFCMFDTAVNFGLGRANQFLAKALGVYDESRPMAWTKEMSNVVHSADAKEVCKKICDQRDAYRLMRVNQNPKQKKFLKGWRNRDNSTRKICDEGGF